MNTSVNIKQITRINIVMVAFLAVSVIGAYATMGIYNNGKNTDRPKSKLLSQQSVLKPGTFTLKSGYLFRGGQLLTTTQPVYLNLNTVATYQIGKVTYTVPLKKQFLMGKVVVNPR
jgi:hypothetical protein